MRFGDRTDAGRRVAAILARRTLRSPLVMALPRGGVPVALEVASALDAPVEVFVARKVGAPGHEEYGIGAVAEYGAVVVDKRALQVLGMSRETFDQLAAREQREVERRVSQYRGDRPIPDLEDRDVVLADDGLATGVTAEAALLGLRSLHPRHLLLAVPVCVPKTAERLRRVADDVVCAEAPERFFAVGQFYERFEQTTDTEVLELLDQARARAEASR
jgi:putative phosphoribosyl transferase